MLLKLLVDGNISLRIVASLPIEEKRGAGGAIFRLSSNRQHFKVHTDKSEVLLGFHV